MRANIGIVIYHFGNNFKRLFFDISVQAKSMPMTDKYFRPKHFCFWVRTASENAAALQFYFAGFFQWSFAQAGSLMLIRRPDSD